MSDELVHLEIQGGIATVTLDSPANRNALSRKLLADLEQHVETAINSPEARVLVLTGTGTVFCSGADLKEQRESNISGGQTGPGGLVPTLRALWHSPKPVIGRINGAARAGGLGLVAACDISVAPAAATFAVSEVRVGVIPAIISVILLPRIGASKAMELFLTAEPIDAVAAAGIGLLTAACEPEALDTTVERYTEQVLKGAPGALAGAKKLVRDIPLMEMDDAFTYTTRLSAEFFASEEAREGMTAFAERRPPSWQT